MSFAISVLIIFLGCTINAPKSDINNENIDTIINKGDTIVEGTAHNEKPGAVLRNSSGVFIISDLRRWDDSFLGKCVRVQGEFKPETYKNVGVFIVDGDTFRIRGQRYQSKTYYIFNAEWELCR